MGVKSEYFDVLFDGPPGHTPWRFVEVENDRGQAIRLGEWTMCGDYWALRINVQDLVDRLGATPPPDDREREELVARCAGQVRTLTRIRAKTDTATGASNDCDDRDLVGRAAGAEGAVDLLIARHAGALQRIAELEEALKSARGLEEGDPR